ncbi:MAG: hypothetical protein ACR2OD_06955, partial [Gaiellaceae bacterium]
GEERFRALALTASARILEEQLHDGSWSYPNREWKGRVATVEGIWASVGLLASAERTGDERYLSPALRWHRYMVDEIGFQRSGNQLAVNYFAGQTGVRVPNNSANALRLFATLADVTGDREYLAPCAGLIEFLESAQMTTGEFPYAVPGDSERGGRVHFQCFQYNAFILLGLMRYLDVAHDAATLSLVRRSLRFLAGAVTEDGAVRYACGTPYRRVTYHGAAVAAALRRASLLEPDDGSAATKAGLALAHVLDMQQGSGAFAHSVGDYRLLSDRRAYPRYLAMILNHLLQMSDQRADASPLSD